MAHDDLRDWVKVLDKAGELKRIREEVDPILEIAEITDRVCKIGKPSGKVRGNMLPVGRRCSSKISRAIPVREGADEPVWQRAPDEAGAAMSIRWMKSRDAFVSSWRSSLPKACCKS